MYFRKRNLLFLLLHPENNNAIQIDTSPQKRMTIETRDVRQSRKIGTGRLPTETQPLPPIRNGISDIIKQLYHTLSTIQR